MGDSVGSPAVTTYVFATVSTCKEGEKGADAEEETQTRSRERTLFTLLPYASTRPSNAVYTRSSQPSTAAGSPPVTRDLKSSRATNAIDADSNDRVNDSAGAPCSSARAIAGGMAVSRRAWDCAASERMPLRVVRAAAPAAVTR